MRRRTRYAELFRRRSHRHPPDGFDGRRGHLKPWPTERLPLPSGSRQPSLNPLADPLALELRQRAQDVQLQTPGRSAEVDPLIEADEAHPDGLQLVE